MSGGSEGRAHSEGRRGEASHGRLLAVRSFDGDQRQGQIAGGGGQAQGVAVHRHGIGALDAQAHRGQVRALAQLQPPG